MPPSAVPGAPAGGIETVEPVDVGACVELGGMVVSGKLATCAELVPQPNMTVATIRNRRRI